MRKTYSEFCSRHTKALKLYKELYARDKRFQQFIRVSRPLRDLRPEPALSWGALCALGAPWSLSAESPHGAEQMPRVGLELTARDQEAFGH